VNVVHWTVCNQQQAALSFFSLFFLFNKIFVRVSPKNFPLPFLCVCARLATFYFVCVCLCVRATSARTPLISPKLVIIGWRRTGGRFDLCSFGVFGLLPFFSTCWSALLAMTLFKLFPKLLATLILINSHKQFCCNQL
jgi:hypothetical protein